MRGHKRKFTDVGFEHVFQHAKGYNVLFYSWEDRLVFFTIFSTFAKRFDVTVIALALMFNHFHCLINAGTSRVMALFIGTVTSTYAMAFNKDGGRKGPLFEKAYGNASKRTDKIIRTAISYNYNNSVEKGLFTRAEEDRWNFLAYIGSEGPFSAPLRLSEASKDLKNSILEVKQHLKDGAYLRYMTIRRLFKNLSHRESEQLLDYIIGRYLPIDKKELLSFYKSYEDMVIAINSNTGSEYEIREEYTSDSDKVYVDMLGIVNRSSYSANPHRIVSASRQEKEKIFSVLKTACRAKDYQVSRLLHLNE